MDEFVTNWYTPQCVSLLTDGFFLWQYLFGQNTPNIAQLYVRHISLVQPTSVY